MSKGLSQARRASTGLLLALLLLATVLGSPLLARADPTETDVPPPPPPAPEVTLPWTALGLGSSVTIGGPNASQVSTLPVPSGLTAQRLRGLMNSPVNFGAGFLEIRDGRGVVLGTVELPPVSASAPVVPFDVDISAAQVTASSMNLAFAVRQVDDRGQLCGPEQRLVLTELATVFGGTDPAPTTIADFFPSVLVRATIYAPADADRAEQESVLALASALTRLYLPQPIATTVVTQPRGAVPPPGGPLTRAIVVERGNAGLDVVNAGNPGEAYLRVSGSGDQLLAQTSLLVNRLQTLAQVQTALVTQAGANGDVTPDVMTFGQLKINGSVEFLRSADFGVGFDRAALGSRVDSIQVRLLASYTPVASQDTATLTVLVNGQALYSAPLDSSGRVDAAFDIPRFLLSQRMNLNFRLTYTPPLPCSPWVAPLTFQLDPRSTLTARRGGAVGAEFTSLPSEFSPNFLVAFDGSSAEQLRYAARVLVAMAHLTTAPLAPHVVDVNAAIGADKGALIVANAKTMEKSSLPPPIGGNGSSVNINLPNEVRTDIDSGLGSIQVLADQAHQRTVVLVTTSGDWALVEPILDYIDGLPNGWASLTGNVLAAGRQGSVADLSIGLKNEIVPENASASSASSGMWRTWLAVGLGLACVVAVAAALWWRRERTRVKNEW